MTVFGRRRFVCGRVARLLLDQNFRVWHTPVCDYFSTHFLRSVSGFLCDPIGTVFLRSQKISRWKSLNYGRNHSWCCLCDRRCRPVDLRSICSRRSAHAEVKNVINLRSQIVQLQFLRLKLVPFLRPKIVSEFCGRLQICVRPTLLRAFRSPNLRPKPVHFLRPKWVSSATQSAPVPGQNSTRSKRHGGVAEPLCD